MARDALITLDQVAYAYDGEVVVDGLDFTVRKGDYLTIVGENGSGKTTLLKGLLRLKTPYAGRVIYADGVSGHRIGYLPQRTPAQKAFPATVREVVMTGCLNRRRGFGFYSKADRRRAESAMARLDLRDMADISFRRLSGGQQQRVLLARALTAAEDILLLDEPTAGLDPIVSHDFYDLIRSLNREDDVTILMVSHDIHCVMRDATHVLHLGNRQLFFGTKEAYLQSVTAADFLKPDSHDNCIVPASGERSDRV